MHLKGHLLLPLPAAVMSIGCQVSIFLENSRESTLNLREGQLKKNQNQISGAIWISTLQLRGRCTVMWWQ